MKRSEVEEAVRELFVAILKRPVAPEVDVVRDAEPGWDSLKHMDLLFTLEERFEMQFTQEEIPELNRLSRIVNRVVDSLETRHSP